MSRLDGSSSRQIRNELPWSLNNPWRIWMIAVLLYCLLGQSLPKTMIVFEANDKPVSSQEKPSTHPIQLQYTSAGHVLGFADNQVLIGSQTHALTITLVNAQTVHPEAGPKTIHPMTPPIKKTTPLNRSQIEKLTSVYYHNLWPGITVSYQAQPGAIVKSNYHVAAGFTTQTLAQIHVRFSRPLTLDHQGQVKIKYQNGEMRESAPIAWQEIRGHKKMVQAKFYKINEQEVGFNVSGYDHRYALVIDPAMTWNTFIGKGESDLDYGQGIAVDGSGNSYIIGSSDGPWGSTTVRGYSGARSDVYVAKLDTNGNFLWNTFFGGAGDDQGYAIALDTSGNSYVCGRSGASWGTPRRAIGGSSDAFVAKLDSNGNLQWNTFLGGSSDDYARAVVVDSGGNVYVSGTSQYTWGSPVRAYGGWDDAFVAKLDVNGVLLWNTFLGLGGNHDQGNAIAVDASGYIYVAGTSYGTWGTPVRAYGGGNSDAFAAKLDTNGNLLWNTFLGGSANYYDYGYAIGLDGSGNVFVAGTCDGTWGTTLRAHDGLEDAFAAKLDNDGNLLWNTFLGGVWGDYGNALTIDLSGNLYVAGSSYHTWGTPVRAYTSNADMFVVKVDTNGNVVWNSFFGGARYEYSDGIAVDGGGNVYIAGDSNATWGTPVRAYRGGGKDAAVAKVDSSGAMLWNTFLGGIGRDYSYALAVDNSGNIYMGGASDASWGAPQRAFASSILDGYVVKLDSSGNQLWNTFLGGAGSD